VLLTGALTLLGRGRAVRRSGQAALVWWALVTGLLVVTGGARRLGTRGRGRHRRRALGLGVLGVVRWSGPRACGPSPPGPPGPARGLCRLRVQRRRLRPPALSS
jgi:hypothetical protein